MILVSPQVKQKRDEEEDDLSSAAQSLYCYVKVARNAKSQQKKEKKNDFHKG